MSETNEEETMKDEKLWTRDFKIIFEKSFDIIPNNSMTFNQKLNSLTRFFIIISIVFFMMYGNKNVFLAPIVFMFFIYVIFASSENGNLDTFSNGTKKPENCKEPTLNNPFMNLLLTDINRENGNKVSCGIDDVEKEITENFNANLYFEADDIFQKNNSQRQFYTVPNTESANRQHELGEWLYNIGPTLKEKHIGV